MHFLPGQQPLAIEIIRHEFARRALGRAGIRRRRPQDFLDRVPLDAARDVLDAAFEAGILIAAAGARGRQRLSSQPSQSLKTVQ